MPDSLTELERISVSVRETDPDITFTMFEVGALPLGGSEEPFYQLLELFPGSRIIAFEVDEKLCDELNEKSDGMTQYFPYALGRNNNECTFYETNHPMCGSLYKPNESLLKEYNNLDVAMLKSEVSLNTITLDNFIKDQNIDSVDFIKIDVQGAELDVFQGGCGALTDTVVIVSEVEFIPMYIDQPLFGDVCEFLAKKDLMFHKFLGIAGRSLKPIILNDNVNYASQHMWSDAVFIRDIGKLTGISSRKLLKMGLLSFLYGSPDVMFYCLKEYDSREGTNLYKTVMQG